RTDLHGPLARVDGQDGGLQAHDHRRVVYGRDGNEDLCRFNSITAPIITVPHDRILSVIILQTPVSQVGQVGGADLLTFVDGLGPHEQLPIRRKRNNLYGLYEIVIRIGKGGIKPDLFNNPRHILLCVDGKIAYDRTSVYRECEILKYFEVRLVRSLEAHQLWACRARGWRTGEGGLSVAHLGQREPGRNLCRLYCNHGAGVSIGHVDGVLIRLTDKREFSGFRKEHRRVRYRRDLQCELLCDEVHVWRLVAAVIRHRYGNHHIAVYVRLRQYGERAGRLRTGISPGERLKEFGFIRH